MDEILFGNMEDNNRTDIVVIKSMVSPFMRIYL